MPLFSHRSGLGSISQPDVSLLWSFSLGSFGLSPSAKNEHSKLKFDVEKVDRNSHLLFYRTQNYKSNCTIYTTKNDSHYFLIAQKMLESQICLWCIFVNNLPDKVS